MSLREISKYRDVWMAIAILWVVLFHCQFDIGNGVIKGIKYMGYGGVDIFLFASGIGCFCSLEKEGDSFNFIKRRVKRIIPTYWVFLVAWSIYSVILNGMSWNAVLGNFLCVRNFTGLNGAFNWYISGMWLMYFLAPFLKGVVDRINSGWKFVTVLSMLLLLTICFWESNTYIITISRIPIFFVGMQVGKMICENKVLSRKEMISLMIGTVVGTFLLCYCVLKKPDFLQRNACYWYPFILITPGLCLMISVMMELQKKYFGTFIEEKLSIPGKYSFEIYLIHIWFYEILEKRLIANGIVENKISVWIITVLLLIPACFILRQITVNVVKIINKMLKIEKVNI